MSEQPDTIRGAGEALVVDLAEPGRTLGIGPHVERVQVSVLWDGTAVGELVAEVGGAPRSALAVPEDVLRTVAALDAAKRLRPVLAPAPDLVALPVAVVVCTLGRPEQLADCLTSLAGLRTAPAELIVVDNDPSDPRSAEVAHRFGAQVVPEPRRGLSAARNSGIRAASSPVVAFLDDDCRVEPGWLDDVAADFADPLVAAVVGYVGAGELETDAQWLFEAQGGFERRHHVEVRDGAVAGGWGAAGFGDGNVFFRREAFERIGGYAEALGPGTPARSAQDADMLYRLMEEGLRVRYSPSRVAWHRHRRELEPLAATLEGYMTGLSAHALVTLARRRDPAALRLWWWFVRRYAPRLVRDLLRNRLDPGRARLLAVQARGIALGPWRGRDALKDLATPAVSSAAPRPDGPRVTVAGEPPTISVVLASRDRREQLVTTLRALAAQAFPAERMEVVLVLDGATDGSAQAARALEVPWPLRVDEQPGSGLAVARNRGIELAANDLLVIADDDIVPERDLVAAHAVAHASGGDAIVMGVHPMVADPAERFSLLVRAWWADHFRRKLAPGWQPSFMDYCDGNSSLPRGLFDRLGRFDTAFTGGRRQDWEFAMRALSAGVPLRMAAGARGTHYPRVTFAGGLRNARQEGRYDVLLARAHPDAAGRLPLGRLAQPPDGARERRLRDLAAPVPDAAWVAAASAAERTRSWGTWMRVVMRAQRAAYLAGVAEGIEAEGPIDEALARVRSNADVLGVTAHEGDPPLRLPADHFGRVELALRAHGRDARVEATTPGETWDAEAVLQRAATALAQAPAAPETLELVRG
jgi:glycosyltransferase involved in cell wall biosynthesis